MAQKVATFFWREQYPVPNTLVKLEEDILKYIFGLVDFRSWGAYVTEPHCKTRSFFNFFSALVKIN
jgi:hypothetical protein